jgi:hypothetical protein
LVDVVSNNGTGTSVFTSTPVYSTSTFLYTNILLSFSVPTAGGYRISFTQPANSAIKLDNVALVPAPSAPAVGLAALLLAARRRRGR